MKLELEQRRQAMLLLHLSDQQVYCLLCCDLYYRLNGKFAIIFQIVNDEIVYYVSSRVLTQWCIHASRGAFYSHGLISIKVRISNHIHYKIARGIAYSFLNLGSGYVILTYTLLCLSLLIRVRLIMSPRSYLMDCRIFCAKLIVIQTSKYNQHSHFIHLM